MQQIALWPTQNSNSSGMDNTRTQPGSGEFKSAFDSAVGKTQQGTFNESDGQNAQQKALDAVSQVGSDGVDRDANRGGQSGGLFAGTGRQNASSASLDGSSLPLASTESVSALPETLSYDVPDEMSDQLPEGVFNKLSSGLPGELNGDLFASTELSAQGLNLKGQLEGRGSSAALINSAALHNEEGSGLANARQNAAVGHIDGLGMNASSTEGPAINGRLSAGGLNGVSDNSAQSASHLDALAALRASSTSAEAGVDAVSGARESALRMAQSLASESAAGNKAFGANASSMSSLTGASSAPFFTASSSDAPIKASANVSVGGAGLSISESSALSGNQENASHKGLLESSLSSQTRGAATMFPEGQTGAATLAGGIAQASSGLASSQVNGLSAGRGSNGLLVDAQKGLGAPENISSGLDSAFNEGSVERAQSLGLTSEQLKGSSLPEGAVKAALESAVKMTGQADLAGANDSVLDVPTKFDVSVGKASEPSLRDQNAGLRPYVSTLGLPVDDAEWAEQMGQKLAFLHARNITSTELHLNPADLGPIDVKISMNGDQTTINFNSQNASVRELLEANIHRLREMLAEQSNTQNSSGGSSQNSDQQAEGFAGQQGQQEGYNLSASVSRGEGVDGIDADEGHSVERVVTSAADQNIVDAYI
jgi:flagellar hook-length control protein FliK